jgi:hypothetical protein
MEMKGKEEKEEKARREDGDMPYHTVIHQITMATRDSIFTLFLSLPLLSLSFSLVLSAETRQKLGRNCRPALVRLR